MISAQPYRLALLVVSLLLLGGTSPAQAVTWTDITAGTNLDDAGESNAFAWGDIDRDGDLDLYVVNATGDKLYRNDGGLVFADVTPVELSTSGLSNSASLLDFDRDGDLDLSLGNNGANQLFRNEGGFVFVDIADSDFGGPQNTGTIAWADYDQDGDLDAYLCNFTEPNVLLRTDSVQLADGSLQIVDFVDVTTPALALVATNRIAAWGDLDNDGDPDLHVGIDGLADKVFENDGGVWIEHTLPVASRSFGVVLADYNEDGLLDIYCSSYTSGNTLFENQGGFTFIDVAPALGLTLGTRNSNGAAWVDWDYDGDLDLYVQNIDPDDEVCENLGGTFSVTLNTDHPVGRDIGQGWVDLQNDGQMELYLCAFTVGGSAPNKLLQAPASGNNWFTVSSRAMPGTRVTLHADGQSWMREFNDGDGLMNRPPSEYVYFGLGSETTIDSLEVRWVHGGTRIIDGSELSINSVFELDPVFPLVLEASDGVHEDRVELVWSVGSGSGRFFELYRDGALITVLSSETGSFDDFGRVPGIVHSYELREITLPDSVEVRSGTDTGSTTFHTPTSMSATDGLFLEGVLVTWSDRSEFEDGYELMRWVEGDSVGTAQTLDSLAANSGSYFDSTAATGTSWVYGLKAFREVGGTPVFSASVQDAGFTAAVLPPVAFSASDGQHNDKVVLVWQHSDPANATWDGYRIYRDNVQIGGDLAPATTLYEDLTGLGVSHDYEIVAFGDVGSLAIYRERGLAGVAEAMVEVESARQLDVGIGGPNTLEGPTQVEATDGKHDDKVVITWFDAPNEDQYVIRRDAVVLDTIAGDLTAYTDVTADPGVVYNYCVQAVAGPGGTSLDDDCDNGDRSLVAPINLAASSGEYEDRIELSWESESTTATLFKIYRDDTPLATVGGATLRYIDYTAGTEVHRYCVAAVTAGGAESDTTDTCIDGLRTITPPTAVNATDDEYENRVELTWSDESEVETGYRIERSIRGIATTENSGNVEILEVAAPASVVEGVIESNSSITLFEEGDNILLASDLDLEATETGLSDPSRAVAGTIPTGNLVKSFYVHSDPVTAEGDRIRLAGTICFSGEVYGLIVTRPELDLTDPILGNPGTTYPTAASVRGLEHSTASNTDYWSLSQDRRRLTFNVSVGGPKLDTFRIITAPGALVDCLLPLVEVVGTTRADEESFEDDTAYSGERYDYCVRAFDATGESDTDCDGGSRRLKAPTQVVASDATFENGVQVEWKDNSGYEDGFHVYRRTANEPSVLVSPLVPANSYSYFDDGSVQPLVYGTVYTYEVAAYDAATGESVRDSDTGYTRLAAPVDVNASEIYADRVVVTWSDVSNLNTGYRLYRDGNLVTAAIGADETSYTQLTSSPLTSALFCVEAYSATDVSEQVCDLGGSGSSGPDVAGTLELDTFVSDISQISDQQQFGTAVAMGTSVALVADSRPNYQRVYIYERNDFGWALTDTLQHDTSVFLNDVPSLAVSEDDQTVVVGNAYSSRVWIYERFGNQWLLAQELCRYSDAVNGFYISASAGPRGSISPSGQVFVESGNNQTFTIQANGNAYINAIFVNGSPLPGYPHVDMWGEQVQYTFNNVTSNQTITCDFTFAMVEGGPNPDRHPTPQTGAAAGGTVTPTASMPTCGGAFRNFGKAVAISGATLAVGCDGSSTQEGEVHVYVRTGGTWSPATPDSPTLIGDTDDDLFGQFIALDGEVMVVGQPDSTTGGNDSKIKIYRGGGGSWTPEATFDGLARNWAGPLDVSGNFVIAGNRAGADEARIYEYDPRTASWAPAVTDHASGGGRLPVVSGLFGQTVAIEGAVAVVGAPDRNTGQGAVGLYQRIDGVWRQTQTVVDDSDDAPGQSGTLLGDSFGEALDLGPDYLIVGAPGQQPVSVGNLGLAAIMPIPAAPEQVAATDGTRADRVQVRWRDVSTSEEGFVVYRDGDEVGTVSANSLSYDDYGAEPGRAYRYEITAFTAGGLENLGVDERDFGRRAPNGEITGRIVTETESPVEGVEVCLDPPGATALQFDGTSGHAILEPGLSFGDDAAGFTLEFWVRPAVIGGLRTLFVQSDESGDDEFRVSLNGAQLEVEIRGSLFASGAGSDLFEVGQWRHVSVSTPTLILSALSPDGLNTTSALPPSNLTLRVYDPDADTLFETSPSWTRTAPYGLGQEGLSFVLGAEVVNGVLSDTFEGWLDDLRIWSEQRLLAQQDADRRRILLGNEPNLATYLPLDHRAGKAAEDLTEDPLYAELVDGVYWVNDAAPMETCALTDSDGNYVLSALRYGESTAFRVIPTAEGVTFEPPVRRISLSRGSPVWNSVDFEDVTQYAVAGQVEYEAAPGCYPAAEIYVDDELAATADENGLFVLAVKPGDHTIEPRLEGHVFNPASFDLSVSEPVDLGLIEDITTRRLELTVGGGCQGVPIADFTVRIRTANNCYDEEVVLSDTQQLDLAPREYLISVVDVANVDPAFTRGQILEFFGNQEALEVDLREDDGEARLFYRAPLQMEITGLVAPTCTELVLPGGGFAALPDMILDQFERVGLEIRVFESYPGGLECLPDTGSVTIFDEVIDREESITLPIKNGVARYQTSASTPNVLRGRTANRQDRSYQKAISFVANVDGVVVDDTKWFLVKGRRARQGTFVATPASEIPIMILRDPPGDGSSAWVESGTSFCTTIDSATLKSTGNGVDTEAFFGISGSAGLGYEIEFEYRSPGGIGFSYLRTTTSMESQTITICGETSQKLSTSSGPLFVGEDGDVYLSVGLNFQFALTDIVGLEEAGSTCTVLTSEGLSMAPSGFESAHLFTREHIENVQIPAAEHLADLSEAEGDAARAFVLRTGARTWEAQLALADSLAGAAVLDLNRSFSAGADLEYTARSTSERSFTTETTLVTDQTIAVDLGGFKAAGNGVSGGYSRKMSMTRKHVQTTNSGSTETVGYRLSDDDIGDFFSVDVKMDPAYGTAVFDLKDGTSSCPWEPGTQQRDRAQLTISGPQPPEVTPADEPAEFVLNISNLGDSDEERVYVVKPVPGSNREGAVLKLNGGTLGDGGVTYYIPARETISAKLTVERGPSAYRYDDLKLIMITPCEASLVPDGFISQTADTLTFSVHFDGPCSEVTLESPQADWLETGNTLGVSLTNIETDPGENKTLSTVGFDYRRVLPGETWTTGLTASPPYTGTPPGVDLNLDVSDPVAFPDGIYEIRAWSSCLNDDTGATSTFTTLPVRGRIDRQGIQVASTEPASSTLALGGVIAATFTEALDCGSVSTSGGGQNVFLTDITGGGSTPVAFTTVCSGDRLVIRPTPAWSTLSGKTLEVRLATANGVTDLIGNALPGDVTWEFTVSPVTFGWEMATDVVEVTLGQAMSRQYALINGSGDRAVNYTVTMTGAEVAHVTAVPSVGSLAPGQQSSIRFEIDDTMPEGNHAIQVTASDGLGQTGILDLTLNVACDLPPWNVDPADFEYTMTLVAELRVNGVVSSDGNDIVAAFVGDEVRGVASPDGNRVYMTLYSNRIADERVRFKAWDADGPGTDCVTYDFVKPDMWPVGGAPEFGDELFFLDDAREGSNASPWILDATNGAPTGVTVIDLEAGWNWVSFNRTPPFGLLSDEVLGDLTPAEGDILKSQSAFIEWHPATGWTGDPSLDSFDVVSGYMLRLSQPGRILLEGDPADSPSVPLISINPGGGAGWNWIGYVPADPQSFGSAFLYSATDGDVFKSQDAFMQYATGAPGSWSGDLTEDLAPGKAYKLYRTGGTTTLEYNGTSVVVGAATTGPGRDGTVPSITRGRVAPTDCRVLAASPGAGPRTADGVDWTLNARQFQYNMTITATVALPSEVTSSEHLVVAAFSGDEVRGLAQPQYIEALDQWLVFLMVFSNEVRGDDVVFKAYDPASDAVLAIEETLTFAADEVLGGVGAPYRLRVSGAEDGGPIAPVLPLQLKVAPNPLSAGMSQTHILYELTEDASVSLDLFDVNGRRVGNLVQEFQTAGSHRTTVSSAGLASGIYLVRLQAGSRVGITKLVVMR